jgi:hypothetical protein
MDRGMSDPKIKKIYDHELRATRGASNPPHPLHDACEELARAYDDPAPQVGRIRAAEDRLMVERLKAAPGPCNRDLAIEIALEHGRAILRGDFAIDKPS